MAVRRSERTLRELVRVIAGRFMGMIVVFVLVVAAAVAVTWEAPKWYQSEVQLLAKPSGQIASSLETPGAMRDEVVLYISTLRSLIASDYVLGSALLRDDKDALGDTKPPKREETAPGKLVAWRLKVAGYVSTHTEEIAKLRDRLSVVTPGGPDATFTQTLRVQVIWPEERERAAKLGMDSRKLAVETAQNLARNVVDAYEERFAELELQRSTAATNFLESKSLAIAKADLDKHIVAYTTFISGQAKADILDMEHMSGRGGGFGTGKASLATTYAGEMARIDELIAGLESMKGALTTQLELDDDDAIAVPDSIRTANESVMALERKILSLKLHINSLTPRYTADYKELSTARAELLSARKEFRNELKKQSTRTQQDLDSLAAKRNKISSSIDAERKRLEQLAVLIPLWQGLKADKEAARTRYDTAMEGVVRATTARELSNAAILLTVLGEPSMPDSGKPAKPIMLVNLILSIVGGFILSLIYAFSADHFDHTFKGVDDAERYLGVPVLSSIPKLGRRMIRAKRGA